MAQKDDMVTYGSWAFLIGILIAFIAGLYQAYTLEMGENFFATDIGGWVAWLLAIIGFIVGFLTFFGKGTITAKEIPGFLIAGIALVVMYGVFRDLDIGPTIGSLFHGVSMSMAIFVAPTVGILSIAVIWVIGRDK
ncbi:MAG: hypothetical protein IMY73_01845 [Bacteroidetes bacterium]|nr:hypothetical protein [Bacteroidota bacterium]